MKLWQKDYSTHAGIESFTVGHDREMDLRLAPFDVLGSLAHITMLHAVGLLDKNDYDQLSSALRYIYTCIDADTFTIDEGIEDVHSQIEFMLTQSLGEVGKRIHSARSRNDQVLVDLKLYFRHELRQITEGVVSLFETLQKQSERYKDVLMPGYTHLQMAMPSSFGLWFGAYAETLTDDMRDRKSVV